MKSLSKAQQEVVDKMQQGWRLFLSRIGERIFIKSPDGLIINLRHSILKCLYRKNVIKTDLSLNDPYYILYALTEQFKTKQK